MSRDIKRDIMRGNNDNYRKFISNKQIAQRPSGIDIGADLLNAMLYPFQRDIVHWALRKGKAAIFADCGLGKTPMQLEWANQILKAEGKDKKILLLAPLAVSMQTSREGRKFGIETTVCRRQEDAVPGINITNYEMLEHFNTDEFIGIVLDESSILKAYTGKIRTNIIESFKNTPYRLACTATPAPNDFMELGNHSEFLGVLNRSEMLSMFFINDAAKTQQWRLKKHAQDKFWQWMASWAVVVEHPSDLGYEDDGFVLPELKTNIHFVESPVPEGVLFADNVTTLGERREARNESLPKRISLVKSMADKESDKCLIWCDFNAESDGLTKTITDAVEVKGSDTTSHKEESLLGFANEAVRILVTKPSIAGFGMNWQKCSHIIFCGISDSYEKYYQAVRRCWRYGQEKPVTVDIVIGEREEVILQNIQRKEKEAKKMRESMRDHMKDLTKQELHSTERKAVVYKEKNTNSESGKWKMYLGDCIEHMSNMDAECIDYSIFSPPFAELYTYSDSERDMGNCKNQSEFYDQFKYAIAELYRVTKSGRNLSFHCMNLPIQKFKAGYIGLHDFRGELIRLFEDAGWIYHSEVCIWKDPVTAMQRTKALGLLWRQILKNSCMSRQGIADYLVTMRKPGEAVSPVTHTKDDFPVEQWQRWASPIWSDINQSNTLQKKSAREHKDEKHICPLQLDVIERAVALWSNPNDLILSPFAGIGSEGYQSLLQGRRFIGIELKESYYNIACSNLEVAEKKATDEMLFAV